MKLIGKIKNMSRRTGAVFMAVAMLLAGLAVGMGIFTNAAYAEDENVQIDCTQETYRKREAVCGNGGRCIRIQ